MPEQSLGEFEELVLLAVCGIPEEAYSVPVQQRIERIAGRMTSFGAVHRALARLEKKGMVASWMGAATSMKGGKPKRLYRVTGLGKEALYVTRQARERMWAELALTPRGKIV